MARLLCNQPAFTMLVANIQGGSDPGRGTPTIKLRKGFRQQIFTEIPVSAGISKSNGASPGVSSRLGLLTGTPTGVNVTVTVDDNDFTYPAVLFIGDYVLTSGEDYIVGGTTSDTATALAAAIDGCTKFTATAIGSAVQITGPANPNVNNQMFLARYEGSIANFTLSETTGWFTGASPVLGPPEII